MMNNTALSQQDSNGIWSYTFMALGIFLIALILAYAATIFTNYSITGSERYFINSGKFDASMAFYLAIALSGAAPAIQAANKLSRIIADLNNKKHNKLLAPTTIVAVISIIAISSYTIYVGSINQIKINTITAEKQTALYKALATAPEEAKQEIAALTDSIKSAQGKTTHTVTMDCNPKYKSCRRAKLELSRTQARAEKNGTSTLKLLKEYKEKAEQKYQTALAKLAQKDAEIIAKSETNLSNLKWDNILYAITPDLFANLFWSLSLFFLSGIPLIIKKIRVLHTVTVQLQYSDSTVTVDDSSSNSAHFLTPSQAEDQFRKDIKKGVAELSVRNVKLAYGGKVSPTAREQILEEKLTEKQLNRKQDAGLKFTYFYPKENEQGGKTLWHPNHYTQPQIAQAGA